MCESSTSISTTLFANALVPTAAYAKKWRERYDAALARSIAALRAGDRAASSLWLELAGIERRLGWQTADDVRRAWMEKAEKLTWNWEGLVK